MKISLSKKESIGVDVWVNDRKITDSSWEVFTDDQISDTIFLVLQDPNSQNRIKININKYTNFEETKQK